MKIKITTAEALILWRLLNSGDHPDNRAAAVKDIGSQDLYQFWDRLDGKLAERLVERLGYEG